MTAIWRMPVKKGIVGSVRGGLVVKTAVSQQRSVDRPLDRDGADSTGRFLLVIFYPPSHQRLVNGRCYLLWLSNGRQTDRPRVGAVREPPLQLCRRLYVRARRPYAPPGRPYASKPPTTGFLFLPAELS